MPRRSKEDRLARVRELYDFDESLVTWRLGDSEIPKSEHRDTETWGRGDLHPTCFFPVSPLPRVPPSCLLPLSLRISLAGFDEAGRGALAGPVVVGCVHFPFFFRAGSSPDASVASGLVSGVALATDNSLSLGYSILPLLAGLDDSKRLTRRQREELFPRIKAYAVWGVGDASAAEIDNLGIVSAVSLAARRAYTAMGIKVHLLLCDRGIRVLRDSETARLNHLAPQAPNFSISRSLNLQITQSFNPSIAQSTELSFTRGDSRSLHIAAASILAKVTRDQMMVELDQRFPGYAFAKHKGYGTAAHIAALRELGPSPIHRRTFHVKLGLRSKDQGLRGKD